MDFLHQDNNETANETANATSNATSNDASEMASKIASLELGVEAREWVSLLLGKLQIATAHSAQAKQEAHIAKQETHIARQEHHLAKLKIDALVLELAHLRRMRFGQSSETIAAVHYDLFDETATSDVADIEALINNAAQHASSNTPADNAVRVPRQGAGRQALPAHLPRIEHRHDLDDTQCSVDSAGNKVCNCKSCGGLLTVIGEDISEQLDVTPAKFFVHRHIRPQYACRGCETVVAAPVPVAVIDGGMAASGLIAWTLTSKFVDHLPLYRLEQIAARSEVSLARSTLAAWVGRYGVALSPLVERLRELLLQRAVLHADETPVQQLAPGKGKTQRAYLWAYCSSALDVGDGKNDGVGAIGSTGPPRHPIVVFDYQTGRSGAHARNFLSGWSGHLMVDDYVGYKALFDAAVKSADTKNADTKRTDTTNTNPTNTPARVIELGCMAHARRKFFELHAANGSPVALEVLNRIGALYTIEKYADDNNLSAGERATLRQTDALPKLAEMKAWLSATRMTTANGSALAKAMDYSLRRWEALSRYAQCNESAQTGTLPIDNNTIENAIRPIALGKKNWLFAGSERAGKRAAAIQSLLATAKRNGIEPQAWLKDVIEKLPTWPNSRIDELLPFAGYRFG
jgi:transposase